MKATTKELTSEYSAALREYLEAGGEGALMRAYQLGRSAIGEGLGVLELAALHQETLLSVLFRMLTPVESARVTHKASEFFAECLAPFEMTRRGILEANAILRDINKELEQRVRAILRDYQHTWDELQERKKMERLKNEFISIVSHELRTPLTSIHGALGLIDTGVGGELPAEAKQLLDVAYRNSQRLVRLVDDILDLQKIESGAQGFNPCPLEVRPLLLQAVEANQAYAAPLGVSLALGSVPERALIYADADRIMQVMSNLLSNAAKVSAASQTVVVSAARSATAIRVAVKDNGPGIPEEFQDRVFQKFAQADSSTTREKGGTGLGLSISKAIVERLGGTIGFESEPGEGTTFYFELPEWREARA